MNLTCNSKESELAPTASAPTLVPIHYAAIRSVDLWAQVTGAFDQLLEVKPPALPTPLCERLPATHQVCQLMV